MAVRFGMRAQGYHRRAARLNLGLYRRVADDVAARVGEGGVVADIGTGPGLMLHHLAGRGLTLHGVDPAPDMVATARAVAGDRDITFSPGTAEATGLPDTSVDVLVSSLSLHHWTNVPKAVQEARRVLKPTGHLVVWDFSFVSWQALTTSLTNWTSPHHTRWRLLFTRITATPPKQPT